MVKVVTQPKKKSAEIEKYYDSVARMYGMRYDPKNLYNLELKYPANYFRLGLLLKSFSAHSIKKLIEVGVGEGTPLTMVGKTGIDVCGFDISNAMVAMAKEAMKRNKMDPNKIRKADIEDPFSYSDFYRNAPYDGLISFGVMPHVHSVEKSLENMASLLRPGGVAYIEFRNQLFSLFTFNSHTKEFILDELLCGVDEKIRSRVAAALDEILPKTKEKSSGKKDGPNYQDIRAKYHNPFLMEHLFSEAGFSRIRILWYHHHPAMPFLEPSMRESFRAEAIQMEKTVQDWRSYFLCSAFVVEGVK